MIEIQHIIASDVMQRKNIYSWTDSMSSIRKYVDAETEKREIK